MNHDRVLKEHPVEVSFCPECRRIVAQVRLGIERHSEQAERDTLPLGGEA